MVARLCLIFSFLLAGDSTLPNGIRVYEISDNGKSGNSFELIAGYRTGGTNEIAGAKGLRDVVTAFLKSTESARAIEVAAYGAGGEAEYFSDLDRTGIRLKMPIWAKSMVVDLIAEFLSETPRKSPLLVDRALEESKSRLRSSSDIRNGIEEKLQIALMGPGARSDISEVTREMVDEFFTKHYGTDRAFVVINAELPKSLQNVERRTSADQTSGSERPPRSPLPSPLPRVQSELDEGAVMWGVPTASIHYRNWYAFLMLDRLIQESAPQKPKTELSLSLEPYFYKLEVTVPSGGLATDGVEAALKQNLNQMQYVRASNEQLEAARRSALQYLESEPVQRWFLSLGVQPRRLEGIDWVRTFSADDMRAAARDLVESGPVIASWAPRIRTLRLDVEKLSDIADRIANQAMAEIRVAPLTPVKVIPFPAHTDAATLEKTPIRLISGVSVVESSSHAVFVAPNSPNSLTLYDQQPGSDLMQTSYGAYRSSRILVMSPPESLDRIKQLWSGFKGNSNDQTALTISGKIPGPYIPALFVLKMMLDRRLIETGIWNETQLVIRASEGSRLTIHGSEANRRIVLSWIEEIATRPIPDDQIAWAREAAVHHLPEYRPDLQSLIWEWTPDSGLIDIHLIPRELIQDVARIYLQ